VFAVVISGAPGAGKSATLMALSDALVDAKIAHAAIDVDEVAWAYPFPDDGARIDCLGAAWQAHRGAGHDLVLVGEVVESPEMLRMLLEAVCADDHLLVRLVAGHETLRERIVAREPPGWSGLDHLLGLTERSSAFAGLDGTHVVVSTDELGPGEVAERIRSACPGRLGGGEPERLGG
jgi:hypothetical protein